MNDLVEKWQAIGLLDGLGDIQKLRLSLKFEMLAKHMVSLSDQPDYRERYGKIAVLMFPLLRKICVEHIFTYTGELQIITFHGGVNPITVLEEFRAWFYSNETIQNYQDISVSGGIDVEAELLQIYVENFAHTFRSDTNYCDLSPIEPLRYIGKHRL